MKADACPGRLNQASLFIQREGTYYGQRSETCGVNHGFMPICVKAVPLEDYIPWVSSQFDEQLPKWGSPINPAIPVPLFGPALGPTLGST